MLFLMSTDYNICFRWGPVFVSVSQCDQLGLDAMEVMW